MKSIIKSKLINLENNYVTAKYPESREIQTRNPICKRAVKVGCPFCFERGRRKNYKNLNSLYKHFTVHHSDQPNHKNIVKSLADLIITGVLL